MKKKKTAWFVYILQCGDESFYVGIAKDAQKRYEMHQSGRGARYTRSRLPVKLLYHEKCKDQGTALKREFQIKRWPRTKKWSLAFGMPALSSRKIAPKPNPLSLQGARQSGDAAI